MQGFAHRYQVRTSNLCNLIDRLKRSIISYSYANYGIYGQRQWVREHTTDKIERATSHIYFNKMWRFLTEMHISIRLTNIRFNFPRFYPFPLSHQNIWANFYLAASPLSSTPPHPSPLQKLDHFTRSSSRINHQLK